MPGAVNAPDYMVVLRTLLSSALFAQNKPSSYLEKNNFSTRLVVPLRLKPRGGAPGITMPAGTEVTFWQGRDSSFCTIFDRLNERQITVRRDGTLSYRKVRNYNGTPAS